MGSKKRKGMAILVLMAVATLIGCGNKVVAVGAIEDPDGQQGYVEIEEFELKDQVKENDKNGDVQYCAVLIPEGYEESAEIPGMYIHQMAPLEASNIYYSVAESEEAGYVDSQLTKEEYQQILSAAMQKAGEAGEVSIESFEEVDLQEVPAYKIKTRYEVENGTIEQLTYLVLADKTYTITYSRADDDDLIADFEISDHQIKLVKKEEVQTAQN